MKFFLVCLLCCSCFVFLFFSCVQDRIVLNLGTSLGNLNPNTLGIHLGGGGGGGF